MSDRLNAIEQRILSKARAALRSEIDAELERIKDWIPNHLRLIKVGGKNYHGSEIIQALRVAMFDAKVDDVSDRAIAEFMERVEDKDFDG